MDEFIETTAQISECEAYRYLLTRVWDAALPSLTFMMLNPSTADASEADPTINRCIGFAKRDGFGGIRVINVYAYRSPNPHELRKVSDPIGPENSKWLENELEYVAKNKGLIVCAWGAKDFATKAAQNFLITAKEKGVDLKSLGFSKYGHPLHPLYLKANTSFVSML